MQVELRCDRCGWLIEPPAYHTINGEWICKDCALADPWTYMDQMSADDIAYNFASATQNLDDVREEYGL